MGCGDLFWRAAIASPRLRRTGRCGRKRLRPSRKVSGQAPPARRTRGGRPLPVAARPAAGRTRRGRRVHSAPPAAHPLEPGSPTPARSGLIEAGYRGGGCSQGRLHNLELRARLRSQCNPAFSSILQQSVAQAAFKLVRSPPQQFAIWPLFICCGALGDRAPPRFGAPSPNDSVCKIQSSCFCESGAWPRHCRANDTSFRTTRTANSLRASATAWHASADHDLTPTPTPTHALQSIPGDGPITPNRLRPTAHPTLSSRAGMC